MRLRFNHKYFPLFFLLFRRLIIINNRTRCGQIYVCWFESENETKNFLLHKESHRTLGISDEKHLGYWQLLSVVASLNLYHVKIIWAVNDPTKWQTSIEGNRVEYELRRANFILTWSLNIKAWFRIVDFCFEKIRGITLLPTKMSN